MISLIVLVSCEQGNRQDDIESLREDHREWEQEYRERDQEVREKRRELSIKIGATARQGTAAQDADLGVAGTQPRPGEDGTAGDGTRARGLGGPERVDGQVVVDPQMREGIMKRLQELDKKHGAMREEHGALIQKHNSFLGRTDLSTLSDDEWENHRSLIESDHDRIKNDLDSMEQELEELQNEAENIMGDRDDR